MKMKEETEKWIIEFNPEILVIQEYNPKLFSRF